LNLIVETRHFFALLVNSWNWPLYIFLSNKHIMREWRVSPSTISACFVLILSFLLSVCIFLSISFSLTFLFVHHNLLEHFENHTYHRQDFDQRPKLIFFSFYLNICSMTRDCSHLSNSFKWKHFFFWKIFILNLNCPRQWLKDSHIETPPFKWKQNKIIVY
jgi:hypothetical protein